MSFIPAVQRVVARRAANDPVRITLEFLLQNGVGRANSVSIGRIIQHLQTFGITMTSNGFQQSVLAESRGSDFFIGSGNRGLYLIDSEADAARMRDFYQNRMRAEQNNLNNLIRTARSVGWTI
jgi:hypothetical protein